MIEDLIDKWWAMWQVPRLEKKLKNIESNMKYYTEILKGGDNGVADLQTLHNLRTARAVTIHEIDYLSGWL